MSQSLAESMQKSSEKTREKIFAAAEKLFSQSGYDFTGVAGICTEAGIGKGAFYYYFKAKPRWTAYSLEVVASNSYFSCQKAHDELCYKPRALRETIAATVQRFKENHPILTAAA